MCSPNTARRAGSRRALYRRVAFSVLISNVDDHLRNHGLLRLSRAGWSLSPAYALNPVPAEERARILSTHISLDDGTCSVDLLEESAPLFGLGLARARAILEEVGAATATWRQVAARAGGRASGRDRAHG